MPSGFEFTDEELGRAAEADWQMASKLRELGDFQLARDLLVGAVVLAEKAGNDTLAAEARKLIARVPDDLPVL